MIGMMALGAVLVIAWVIAFMGFKLAGFFVHLLLIVGAVMLVIGLTKKASGVAQRNVHR